jgi:hypothetical protein
MFGLAHQTLSPHLIERPQSGDDFYSSIASGLLSHDRGVPRPRRQGPFLAHGRLCHFKPRFEMNNEIISHSRAPASKFQLVDLPSSRSKDASQRQKRLALGHSNVAELWRCPDESLLSHRGGLSKHTTRYTSTEENFARGTQAMQLRKVENFG